MRGGPLMGPYFFVVWETTDRPMGLDGFGLFSKTSTRVLLGAS